jgi:hypothetical protein
MDTETEKISTEIVNQMPEEKKDDAKSMVILSKDTINQLIRLKEQGDSYDDVVKKLLEAFNNGKPGSVQ